MSDCRVDSCSKVSMLQWIIGILMTIMLATQGYIVLKVDKIEDNLNDRLQNFEKMHDRDNDILNSRLLVLEQAMHTLVLDRTKK